MENKVIDKNENVAFLVNKYADMVLRLALSYLGNIADAQDACQETFIKLFKHQRSFNDAEHEKAWIIRVAINTCKDVIRSPWKKFFFPVENVLLPVENPENRDVLSSVLKLPVKYRMVIHLYYFEGYRTAEISKIMNRKENTIRTHLKRAKELLKTKMIGGVNDDDEI